MSFQKLLPWAFCLFFLCAGLQAQQAVLVGKDTDAYLVEGLAGAQLLGEDVSTLQGRQTQPDLVVFWARMNKGDTPEQTADTIEQQVRQVREISPKTRVAVVSPILYSPQDKWYGPKARALHKLLEERIPSWPDTVYVDILEKMPSQNRAPKETFFTEGGLLGERGVQIWQDSVRPHIATAVAVAPAEVENHIVAYNPKYFSAWPANGGSWIWGDEMLVSFYQGPFVDKSGHNVDLAGPQWSMCARSLDGGKTWTGEPHPELDRCSTIEAAMKMPRVRDIEPVQPTGGIDFTLPDLALLVRDNFLFVSTDRGHTWGAPVLLPDFGRPLRQRARTAYVPVSKDHCLFFMSEYTYEKPIKKVNRGWAHAFETRDGGKTFQMLGDLGQYPKELVGQDPFSLSQPTFGIMPSFVRMADGTFVAARRSRVGERRWSDIYQSKDEGKTWEFVSVAEEGGDTPPALVLLPDTQQIVLTYCNRFPPYGLRGRVSDDGGKTWGKIYVLRDDGLEWDLGYNRAHLTKDGKIITFYYYTTKEKPQQHIDATIWDVRATLKRDK